MHIASTVPTEEELLKICQAIFQFHQKNPSLLVGIMDMTVFNLPYYIIAQYRCIQSHTNRYLLRTKKATLNELESSLSLSKSESFATDFTLSDIPDTQLLSKLRSFTPHSSNWIQRFHSFTRHSLCLPMKVFFPISQSFVCRSILHFPLCLQRVNSCVRGFPTANVFSFISKMEMGSWYSLNAESIVDQSREWSQLCAMRSSTDVYGCKESSSQSHTVRWNHS